MGTIHITEHELILITGALDEPGTRAGSARVNRRIEI